MVEGDPQRQPGAPACEQNVPTCTHSTQRHRERVHVWIRSRVQTSWVEAKGEDRVVRSRSKCCNLNDLMSL